MTSASGSPPQQFNLRWNNHTNNIIQVFSEHLSNENLVDVTISCQGQFIKAHKMVLSACSPYFQELFHVHQVAHPVIIINGMTFLDVKLVIDFMYRGEVKVQEGDLGGLLLAAETLQVKGLANVRNKYEKGQIQGVDSFESPKTTPNQQDTNKNNLTSQRHLMGEEITSRNDDVEPMIEESQLPSSQEQMFDDDDLPATIKVEPPDIRDIDEEETTSSWDSPRLIIDMKESKETMSDLTRIESIERKRPNILRQPNPSIRVASAHLEISEDDITTEKKETPGISSSAKCFLWPKRQPKILGTWGRTKVCKIPRPPNAFMIFANDWRRKLAVEYPVESNKDISVRLGTMWKNLDADSKETYYCAARKADEEHKQKYPGYYYSPKEARLRKGLKRKFGGGSSPMDALRFVKVFMSSAEKGNLMAEESKSLLRKFQQKPNEDQSFLSPSPLTLNIPTLETTGEISANELVENPELGTVVDGC